MRVPTDNLRRFTQEADFLNQMRLLCACLIVALIGCSPSREPPIASEDELPKNVGKVVVLVGEPVGSKANYALKTKFATIPLDSAWDPSVYVPSRPKRVRVRIRARLDSEEAMIAQDAPSMQSNQSPGQKLPARYVLRNVELIESIP